MPVALLSRSLRPGGTCVPPFATKEHASGRFEGTSVIDLAIGHTDSMCRRGQEVAAIGLRGACTMPQNEFSRTVAVDPFPEDGVAFSEAASASERANVGRRLDLVGLTSLTFTGTVEPEEDPTILRLSGRLEADVVQRCVVTLEPVANRVAEGVIRRFTLTPADVILTEEGDIEVEVDSEAEDVEPLVGGLIDLGEIATEELALALDPYPRAEGADAELTEILASSDDEVDTNPFAALKRLKS
ncbi:YceD family protein [Marinivivus vitaminiproducens]|uniref:YceD family protein n=1 Tax=Marinivivus vitaminiproducens TaxID=3035935 RepID=UPI0027A32319|nr:DUF177 domain-containing protein [Geminicoccaceae bacterium SCSIO 64248]